MNRIVFLVAAVLCGVAAQAFAGSHGNVNEKPLVAETLDTFNQNVAKIHEQMKPGGVYEHVSPTERSRLDQRIQQMRALLQAHSSQNDMPTSDKVALLNAQNEVNSILSHNDNNRLICEHRAPIGSHILVTKCRTYGEIMARREQDRESLRERSRRVRLNGPSSASP